MQKETPQNKLPAKGLPPNIYRKEAYANLRIEMRSAARQRKLAPEIGDRLLWRLSGPLKELEELYQAARAMFDGREDGETNFRRQLLRRIEGAPKDGVRRLRERTGLPAPGFRPGCGPPMARSMARPTPGFGPRRGLDCSLVHPAGMAVLYLGVLRANLGDVTARGLDLIAALSIEQGALEGFHGALVGGGPGGFDGMMGGAAGPGRPGLDLLGEGPGWAGYQPDPGNPFGPTDPWGGWSGGGAGGGLGGWDPPLPEPESCQSLREACESILIDHANAGLPPMPMPPRSSAWADIIDRIEMTGQCAGDLIVILGHGFGENQPPGVHLLMNVNGTCAVVQPESWSDTRIEVRLPAGVRSGPVGFYSAAQQQSEIDRYNHEAASFNAAAQQVMGASRCLGEPLIFDLFRGISRMDTPCPPAGDRNVITAGLPVVHYFHAATDNASGSAIAAVPGDHLMLRWNVENADTIALRHIWESGPNAGSEEITGNAEGTAWDLGPADHAAFGLSRYQLKAINACGQIQAEVRVVRTQRPGLSIERIEVTQCIQTADHDVPLIRHKPTVVRVHAAHALNGFGGVDIVNNVTGRLRVRSGGSWSSWFSPVNNVVSNLPDPPLPDPGASIELPAVPDPTRTNDTVNFVIPEALCTGRIDVEAEVRVDDFGAPPGGPGISERASRTFENIVRFRRRRRLKMRYIPATIVPDPNGNIQITITGPNPPTLTAARSFLLETFKLIPTMPSSIERLEGFNVTLHADRFVVQTLWGDFEFNSGWSESLQYDVEANVFTYLLGILRMCELFGATGIICAEDHDAYWAVLVPTNGVWGRANGVGGREYITPMNAISGAHELAHCLNQHHLPGTGCGGGGSPSADPFEPTTNPANWTDGGGIPTDVAVPFDVIRNRTITNSDDGVWDLMTYCPTRWTTPQRWQMLFDHIGG